LKTTRGLVSRDGLMPLSHSLDTVGPMVRTVRDAAWMLDAIAGPDARDPSSCHAPVRSVLPRMRDGVNGMRVWAMPDEERDGADSVVLDAYDAALEMLKTLGAHVVQRRLPKRCAEYMQMTGGMMSAEGYANLGAICEREGVEIDPYVRRRVLSGRDIRAAEYIDMLKAREQAKVDFAAAMDGADLLLLPTTPLPAVPVDEVDQTTSTMAHFNRMANLLDLCSVAVPAGFSPAGLPVSVQFVGRGWDEPLILRAAYAYEQATRWHERRPEGLA
jgi:aspartyl-tRNA(Asn)/glutamyl-tRNA(Gln) amidotransferase subunit A